MDPIKNNPFSFKITTETSLTHKLQKIDKEESVDKNSHLPQKTHISNEKTVHISDEAKILNDIESSINNPQKTFLKIEKDKETNLIVYKFIDKETNEVIKQIPIDEKIKEVKRIDNFLKRIWTDLTSSPP